MATLKEAFAALPEFRKQLEELLDKELESGLKNIFLVGTGGTYSYALPMTYFAKKTSDFPIYAENGKELMTNQHKQLGKGSLCFYCSATGNTKDILQAMEYTRSKGAHNLAVVSVEENPMKPLADYNFVVEGGSAMYMTFMLLIMTYVFNKKGEFPRYKEFADQLLECGEAFDKARELKNNDCIYHAARNCFAPFHFLVGAGATYGEAYCFGLCLMEEMLWMKTKIINAAEFFHGAIELVEKDTPCILFKGDDEVSRPLVDRVENFLKPLTDEVIVFDTKEVELPLDKEFRELVTPIVASCLVGPLSKAFSVERNHDLSVRRYYRQMEY